MKRRAFVCALLLALASTNAIAAPYNFDYTTDGGQVMGIDRVFDDGQNTVVAFYGPLGYERPTVTTETGNVLPYRVVDRYLVLPGVQRRVLIYARGVVAQVVYGRPPSIQLPAAAYASAGAAFPVALSASAIPAQSMPAAQPPQAAPAPASIAATPAAAVSEPSPVQAAVAPAAAGTVWQTATGHTVRVGVPVAQLPPVPAAAAPAAAAAAPAASQAPAAVLQPAVQLEDRFIVSDEAPPPPKPAWVAVPGASLRVTTEQWASRAGWVVYWNLKNGADYETLATRAEGEFLTALRQLYAPYLRADGDRSIRVAAYPRQNILVISE